MGGKRILHACSDCMHNKIKSLSAAARQSAGAFTARTTATSYKQQQQQQQQHHYHHLLQQYHCQHHHLRQQHYHNHQQQHYHHHNLHSNPLSLRVCDSFVTTVGSTPLLKIHSASNETGCTIWGKCEFLNPGGSVKDRPAVNMLKCAEDRGLLSPGGWVVEASAGNTAIALTLASKQRNYRVICVMPETQTEEKKRVLRALGAVVLAVPFAVVSHANHYTRIAARLAERIGGYYCGQFDNTANRQAHFDTTGLEIWSQTEGLVDGFICAAGTGGTITGVSSRLRLCRRKQLGEIIPEGTGIEAHLSSARGRSSLALTDSSWSSVRTYGDRERPPEDGECIENEIPINSQCLRDKLKEIIKVGGPCIGLADICGAGLYRLYTTGTLQAKGSSIIENIGQNRVTGNLEGFSPDFACEISDEEALTWTHRLLKEEGLALGMTSGVNVAGAVRLARALGPGHNIITILCDFGHLYATKQWNPPFLHSLSLPKPTWMEEEVPTDIQAALESSFVRTDDK